jgi:TRAP-type transport system periplasmic protein
MHPVRIRFGGYQEEASIHNRAAARFGEALEARLGAGVAFELVGSVIKSLGRPSGDLPAMVRDGELSCCYISSIHFTEAVPELKVLELPFVIEDRAAVQSAFTGAYGERCGFLMEERTPWKLLGLWDNGFRHFTNRVRPIRTPADCRGLRVRSQKSAIHVEVFQALGFEPIAVDVKEFAEQVASDRFDAQENPLTNTYNFGVHRHHRYITLSAHLFGAAAMICNKALYGSWPGEVRAAVDAAAVEATRFQHELAAAEDDEILGRLDPHENEVIHLTQAERAAFVAAVQPVVDKHRAEIPAAAFELVRSRPARAAS